jgi:hypothetical protein
VLAIASTASVTLVAPCEHNLPASSAEDPVHQIGLLLATEAGTTVA